MCVCVCVDGISPLDGHCSNYLMDYWGSRAYMWVSRREDGWKLFLCDGVIHYTWLIPAGIRGAAWRGLHKHPTSCYTQQLSRPPLRRTQNAVGVLSYSRSWVLTNQISGFVHFFFFVMNYVKPTGSMTGTHNKVLGFRHTLREGVWDVLANNGRPTLFWMSILCILPLLRWFSVEHGESAEGAVSPTATMGLSSRHTSSN